MGTCFHKKTKKGGSRKDLKISPKKRSKWVPNWGGFEEICLFLGSETCSDPLCCWNAPGLRFFTILASLFLHFCVAARYQEQLFLLPPPQTGGGAKSFNTRGGPLRKHFPSAAHSETLSSGPSPTTPPKLGGVISHFLLLSLHVFLGRVHGDAEIVPEKNRGSFPLSANVFWCWLRMLLLAEYWGCSNSPRKKSREFPPV